MTERVDVIQADRVELLPCPFCGCEAYIDGKTDGPYQACCCGCDARSGPWWSGSTGYARAEAAWNTRIAASEWNEAIDAERARVVAWLRAVRDHNEPRYSFGRSNTERVVAGDLADAIERGDHAGATPASMESGEPKA